MNKTKHLYFAFHKGDILLEKLADGTYTIPCAEEPPTPVPQSEHLLNVASANGPDARTYHLDAPVEGNPRFEMCGLRQSFYKLSQRLYRLAGKCEELLYWDSATHFCGACGAEMRMDSDISKKCTACGRVVWPQLATAIIVLIHRGDDVLLVHAHNFRDNFYGLVAGFVETGETLEEAVHREVMEETGLKIANVRYFGSQPWPYPCGLMIGFHADYASGEIKLQREELSAGAWFNRDNLPEIPEKLSIARRLIDDWLQK